MIPFVVPAQFLSAYAAGQVVRHGALLKNAVTGQIVGHLQETSLLQRALKTGSSLDLSGVTRLFDIVQDADIARKLDAMQGMLGTVQILQVASLASSVAGIGVTAATAAMILGRLNEIGRTLERIEGSVSLLPGKWREMDLRGKLVTLKTSVDRLREAEIRGDADNILRDVEERLNFVFDELHDGLCNIVVEARVDPALLRSLLAGLSLCAGAEIKSLLWLNEKAAAEQRARRQCEKLQDLAFLMPRDVMADKLDGGADEAMGISRDFSEIRLRAASQPALVRKLISDGIHGRAFIECIQNEEFEPVLVVPTT